METCRSTGLIDGLVDAAAGDDRLITTGQVNDIVRMGLGNDRVVNAGALLGDVDLGDGSDLYDGRGGSVVGAVFGGIGNDTVRGGAGGEALQGGDGSDQLSGGGGDDTIDGGKNGDLIIGGAGDDRLTGGKSGDVFAFRGEVGDDLITDFNADEDVIEFAKAIFKTFGKLQPAMDQVGADVVITISADDSITLQNVALGDLTAADFTFVA